MKGTLKMIVFYLKYYLVRDGFGTLMLSNGDKYVGEFKGGFVNGHGTYKYKNGNEV